jgi:hypothetical protein
VRFKGRSIADVLEMWVEEALAFFSKVRRRLQTLHDVGLDYVKLGQPATTLSGDEAQRVRPPDEPTALRFPSLLPFPPSAALPRMVEVPRRFLDRRRAGARGALECAALHRRPAAALERRGKPVTRGSRASRRRTALSPVASAASREQICHTFGAEKSLLSARHSVDLQQRRR